MPRASRRDVRRADYSRCQRPTLTTRRPVAVRGAARLEALGDALLKFDGRLRSRRSRPPFAASPTTTRSRAGLAGGASGARRAPRRHRRIERRLWRARRSITSPSGAPARRRRGRARRGRLPRKLLDLRPAWAATSSRRAPVRRRRAGSGGQTRRAARPRGGTSPGARAARGRVRSLVGPAAGDDVARRPSDARTRARGVRARSRRVARGAPRAQRWYVDECGWRLLCGAIPSASSTRCA